MRRKSQYLTGAAIAAAVFAAASPPASQAADTATVFQPRQSLTVDSSPGAVKISFTNVQLLRAEPGPSNLEVVLRFSGPIDAKIAEGLDKALPDWIEYATPGYDSLLIRTKKKAAFGAESAANGFVLRISWAAGEPDPRYMLLKSRYLMESGDTIEARKVLRGLKRDDAIAPDLEKAEGDIAFAERDPRAAIRRYERAIALRPTDDGLREAKDNVVREITDRATGEVRTQSVKGGDTQTVTQLGLRASFSESDRIETQLHLVYLKDDVVQRSTGAISAFEGSRLRLNATYFSDLGGGDEWGATLFAAQATIGVGAEYAWRSAAQQLEFKLAYRESYWDFVEGIADRGTRDSAQASWSGNARKAWFANVALRLNRFGIDGRDDVGRSVSAQVGLEYRTKLSKAGMLTLRYGIDAEYVGDVALWSDGLGGFFSPLPLTDREIHSVALGLFYRADDSITLEGAGGYAHDRFGGGGFFGRAALGYEVTDALHFAANASYSQVSSRGIADAGGAVSSASLSLTYAFPAPGSILAPVYAP
jgi:hypothetical protein